MVLWLLLWVGQVEATAFAWAILSFVQGKDIFVSLPRGSGKSYCFYALPLFFDKLRNYSEPKSVVVVLLEFIVVYAKLI